MLLKTVGEPEGKRDLGTDDDEGDLLALHEGDEAGDIVGGDGKASHLLGDAGVAGRADDTGRGGRGDEGADERVFTATGADDEEGAWKRCLGRWH